MARRGLGTVRSVVNCYFFINRFHRKLRDIDHMPYRLHHWTFGSSKPFPMPMVRQASVPNSSSWPIRRRGNHSLFLSVQGCVNFSFLPFLDFKKALFQKFLIAIFSCCIRSNGFVGYCYRRRSAPSCPPEIRPVGLSGLLIVRWLPSKSFRRDRQRLQPFFFVSRVISPTR